MEFSNEKHYKYKERTKKISNLAWEIEKLCKHSQKPALWKETVIYSER